VSERAPGGAIRSRPVPWRRGVAWLLFLGPFFFASYGFANWASMQRAWTGVLFFSWERAIPFLPWTIVPYWSIDLLYGLSFLACRDEREVDRHGLRLLTVQLVAIACFLAFPMRFSFERPGADGAFGTLFAALASFDQPFNQAPSLHVAILVIVWTRIAPRFRGWAATLVHGWLALIGVSVLTTYQHHFVDIPTGALLGVLAMWLWPDEGRSPLARARLSKDRDRLRLSLRYGAAAVALAFVALWLRSAALWLLWPALSLALVALAYAALGAAAFQKRGASHSFASACLFAPYTLGAWFNSRLWTLRRPRPDAVADGVWIGRIPTSREAAKLPFAAIVDLAAELPGPEAGRHYASLPWLDLVVPDAAEAAAAARAIEAGRRHGDVLVCCALGYGRAACAVAAWLITTGRARDAEEALATMRARRPGVAARRAHVERLSTLSSGAR
jgi:protein-tyrosine phosphatase